jgi:hypothetical protein
MAYLLKELELHVGAENALRDSAEQVLQSFLTTITAITGAVILVAQNASGVFTDIISILLGSTLILGFSIFTFIRVAANRQGLSFIRYRLYVIRKLFMTHGIKPVDVIFSQPAYPNTIFSSRVINFFVLFAIFCGLMLALVIMTGIVSALYAMGKTVFEYRFYYFFLYGLPALAGFLICFGLLLTAVKQGSKREQAIWKDSDYRPGKVSMTKPFARSIKSKKHIKY